MRIYVDMLVHMYVCVSVCMHVCVGRYACMCVMYVQGVTKKTATPQKHSFSPITFDCDLPPIDFSRDSTPGTCIFHRIQLSDMNLSTKISDFWSVTGCPFITGIYSKIYNKKVKNRKTCKIFLSHFFLLERV